MQQMILLAYKKRDAMKIGNFEVAFDIRFIKLMGFFPFLMTAVVWFGITVMSMPFLWHDVWLLLVINCFIFFTAYPSPKRVAFSMMLMLLESALAFAISTAYVTYLMVPFAKTAVPLVQTYPWNLVLAVLPFIILAVVMLISYYKTYQIQDIDRSHVFKPPFANPETKEIYFNRSQFKYLPKRKTQKSTVKKMNGKEPFTLKQKIWVYVGIGIFLWYSNFAIFMYLGRGWLQGLVAYTVAIGSSCILGIVSAIFLACLRLFIKAEKKQGEVFRLGCSEKTDFSGMTYEEVYGKNAKIE